MTTKQASIGLTAFCAVITVFIFTASSQKQVNSNIFQFQIIGAVILIINLFLSWLNFRSSNITNKRILTLLTLFITVIYAVFFLFMLQQNNH
jgi:phosphatidylserine synthase